MTDKNNKAVFGLSFTHDVVALREIDKEKELDDAVALLIKTLGETDAEIGKTLYGTDADSEHAFLENVSHLYGAFTHDDNTLVGLIAVEDDAVERIVVQREFQDKGIGAEMMRAVRIVFDAEYVDVFADNKRALAFFEAQGMSMFDETAPEPGDLSATSPYKIVHLMY